MAIKRKRIEKYQLWATETLERDNHLCVDCGNSEVLVVHHIDNSRKLGNKLMNNDLSNLVTVCRPCHSRRHSLTSNEEDIVEMIDSGESFSFVGRKIGVSRERIRQVYYKYYRTSPVTPKTSRWARIDE